MFERLVQRNYDALNRRDLPAIMRSWADDGVWEFPGHTPMSGRFEGKPAIEDWFRRWTARYASVRFTVRHAALANPIALTFANTLFVAWDVDVVTTDGTRAEGSGITVAEMRRGKVVHSRDYLFDPTVLERIWGTGSRPPATSRAPRATPERGRPLAVGGYDSLG